MLGLDPTNVICDYTTTYKQNVGEKMRMSISVHG
jgi:hypothetical protein